MNMFTDPVTGPIMIVIVIIACLAAGVFLVMENWPKPNTKTKTTARYENYIIVDGEIIYPKAVIDHVDIKA